MMTLVKCRADAPILLCLARTSQRKQGQDGYRREASN